MVRCLLVFVLAITPLAVQAKQCGRVRVDNDGLSDRVIGGHVTQKRNWPWLVQVEACRSRTDCMGCSGTIVSDRHVLTAAHCFMKVVNPDTNKRLPNTGAGISSHNGSLSKDNLGFLDQQVTFTVHPKYDYKNLFPGHDVAIVELSRGRRFTFSEYEQPICIVDSFRENIGETGYVVGYGYNSVNRSVPDTPIWNVTYNDADGLLHENIIEFRTIERCSSVKYPLAKFIRHAERTICAVGNNRVIAKGDSGGPLMVNRKGVWYQVGISSLGAMFDDDDGQNKWYSMYMRVSRACDWIDEVTSGYVKCASMDG